MGNTLLAVQDNMVTLQQYKIAVGNQHHIIAFDHHNDGLSGNIQIPDLDTVTATLISRISVPAKS